MCNICLPQLDAPALPHRPAGDQVIVLAEDDDTYRPVLPVPQLAASRCPNWAAHVLPERILFCGWRRDMDDLIMVLDQFVCPGSELYLYNEVRV